MHRVCLIALLALSSVLVADSSVAGEYDVLDSATAHAAARAVAR
jgi:hypothetical protein